MLLRFPDLDTLLLTITSGIVPFDVVTTAAAMVAVAEEPIAYWVRCEASLSAVVMSELRSVGVTSPATAEGIELRSVQCWMEGVPVEQVGLEQITHSDKTPVLFRLGDVSKLPELINEMLRLGNDRQAFRVCGEEGETTAILRVIGPPYYTLLRALGNDAEGIAAFVEASARVWVELGCRHPLAEMIQPAAGEQLLIERDGTWRSLPEHPFRDVYELLTFQLPSRPSALSAVELRERISVPLRLMRGGEDQPTEMWVLTNNAKQQVEQFVQTTSDEVLTRLSFAVAVEDDPTILIRVRPGRSAPPVLVFDGLQCRPYLRIPNLFLPIGHRVHPPLRRDVVKRMLAPNDGQVVWIEPRSDGRFAPRSVDETMLRPLTDWVDYVLDEHHEALDAWRQSHRCEFDDFICRDDQPSKKKRSTVTSEPTPREPATTSATIEPQTERKPDAAAKERISPQRPRPQRPTVPHERRQLEEKLQGLEVAFKGSELPLDHSDRFDQWRTLADLNSRLGRLSEASLLRLHEIWEADGTAPDAVVSWFQNELEAARQHGAMVIIDEQEGDVTDLSLSRLLSVESPTPAEVSELAAYLTFATVRGSTGLLERQRGRVHRYFLQNETMLSSRSCWLSWCSLAQMSGGDSLALARARDRLLARLHQNGVIRELDVPAFLRSAGGKGDGRFGVVRDRLAALHACVQRFARRNLRLSSQMTLHYIDLLFALTAARMGESQKCRELSESARLALCLVPDPVHGWLWRAFMHRTSQAEQGLPVDGPLPKSFIVQLQGLDKLQRYKVDRLRQHSSVLEPHETLDPYRDWRSHRIGEFDREVTGLFDVTNRNKLLSSLKALFAAPLADDDRAKLLTAALELSPRLGEKFAVKILEQVVPLDRKLKDPVARAGLLEHGLEMAAHFDQREHVTPLLDRLRGLLHQQSDAEIKTLEALECVLQQSSRGLRRLGMRDELAQLLEQFADVVNPSDDPAMIEPERLRVMLRLAAGWFTFGQNRGWVEIDQARDLLFSGDLMGEGHVGAHKQTRLACAYIAAVGEAPLEDALARWEEMFDHLNGIHDASTVNTHYSLKLLDVVETLVMTITGEGFTVDKTTQRWFDDEEYLIRRRIHRDMRRMVAG